MKKPKLVHIKLCDGRVLLGTVCRIEKTVAGTKVRILSGACLLTVNADQIIRKRQCRDALEN
jgi:hypothetical protein